MCGGLVSLGFDRILKSELRLCGWIVKYLYRDCNTLDCRRMNCIVFRIIVVWFNIFIENISILK